MANPKHLEILKKGVNHWNQWRGEYPNIIPDLQEADLIDMNLSNANLSDANLRGVQLNGVDLSDADLSDADVEGASLGYANLSMANLCAAELSEVDLRGAILREANLFGASLRHADISEVDLHGANLSKANFYGTFLSETQFLNIDLSQVNGLAHCEHGGPSSIDQLTLIRSGKLPEAFLRGCGFPDKFIEYLPSLLGSLEPIQFYSSFISYSTKDDELVQRLYTDLQAKGIRCWFAPEDLKTGEKFRTRIDEVIRVHDKLLLVLSESSVNSEWVEKEVLTAFEKERELKETVLFPIRLDNAVMKIKNGWPADIRRSRHIGDFTDWKNHDSYKKAFGRLLRDLGKEDDQSH